MTHTKTCKRCNEAKTLDLFGVRKNSSDGRHTRCLICAQIEGKEYYAKNRERILAHCRTPERRKRMGETASARYHSNDTVREQKKAKARAYSKTEPIRARNRERQRRLRETDPSHRVHNNLSKRVRRALEGIGRKSEKTRELVGCDFPSLMKHIESLFRPGMTWDNYGKGEDKWHIDHITPCSSFDLTDVEQQRKCFHYSNLQPLWERLNMAKGNKPLDKLTPDMLPIKRPDQELPQT